MAIRYNAFFQGIAPEQDTDEVKKKLIALYKGDAAKDEIRNLHNFIVQIANLRQSYPYRNINGTASFLAISIEDVRDNKAKALTELAAAFAEAGNIKKRRNSHNS